MNLAIIPALLSRQEKRRLIFILFALLVMGIVEVAGVGALGPFMAVVSEPAIIHTNAYLSAAYTLLKVETDNAFIVFFGIAVISVLALSNFCISAINYILNRYTAKCSHAMSIRLFERYLRQPYMYYLNINSAELTKRIWNDVPVFVNEVLFRILSLISSAVIALFIFILLVAVNPLLAALISLVLGVSYILIFTAVRKFLARKGAERNRQDSLKYKYINETFGGIKDIKILGKEQVFLNFYREPSRLAAMSRAAGEIVGELPKYIIETIVIGGIIGVIIAMIQSGSRIEDFIPVLTVFAFGAYRFLPLLQKIFRAVSSIRYNSPVMDNLYQDLVRLPEGAPLAPGDAAPLDFHRAFRLENISFAYPRTETDTIKNQSVTIARNTSVALVGATGCGKTTLADIILGLLEPQAGKLYVDDTEITAANRRNWQRNLGYVPQSIYLTDDTIRNNIAFGVDPALIDDGAVEAAARLANIHDFVTGELKEGYGTVIGEKGIRLSGGQRQRIGIARAVYHDPPILILDEATSALDSLTENAIMDAIKNVSHKKTIIMIAHRITTVKSCDTIYMMDRGIITDSGNYAALYAGNPAFRKMADGVI
jgi:ABC-type multidrug transport system fused ATPase/permease subunit